MDGRSSVAGSLPNSTLQQAVTRCVQACQPGRGGARGVLTFLASLFEE